jgi:mannose-1-phosphate guanylyltransferase
VLYFKTLNEYAEISTHAKQNSFILEPVGRNTAPAIVIAALQIAEFHGLDAVVLIAAADHLIQDEVAFAEAVRHAALLAKQKNLITFGIKPDYPETGFGYIEAGASCGEADYSGSAPAFNVTRFVEKPDLATAKTYVEDGRHYWNSGMFAFNVGTYLEEMASYAPEMLAQARVCIAQSKRMLAQSGIQDDGSHLRLDPATFSNMDNISVDYALMERSKKVVMVKSDIGWSDIGSWAAVSELVQPDNANNRFESPVEAFESTNCYVHHSQRMVGLVGVQDLMVVDTPDALLITHADRTQDVKQIVMQLKQQNHESYKIHNTVHRPWGTYTVLEIGGAYKIKRIEVKPQASLSLQLHDHRCEHWVLVRGVAEVTNGNEIITLNANESTYIKKGTKHRLRNLTDETIVLIEVQTGTYLGEDDITRFGDVYGRTT